MAKCHWIWIHWIWWVTDGKPILQQSPDICVSMVIHIGNIFLENLQCLDGKSKQHLNTGKFRITVFLSPCGVMGRSAGLLLGCLSDFLEVVIIVLTLLHKTYVGRKDVAKVLHKLQSLIPDHDNDGILHRVSVSSFAIGKYSLVSLW